MPKSSIVMNSRYDEIIILLIFFGSQDHKSNRGSLGSFGMSFNSRIPMPKSSTVMNSRYGEIIIPAKLLSCQLQNW